jgi:hypothetical protein
VINTAYIERLNATFRQRLDNLTRHTRRLARHVETLTVQKPEHGAQVNRSKAHTLTGACRTPKPE